MVTLGDWLLLGSKCHLLWNNELLTIDNALYVIFITL